MSSLGGFKAHRQMSPSHVSKRRDEIARCRAEVAAVEGQIRAGHSDLLGLLLALADWSAELRLLEREANEGAPKTLEREG